MTVDLRPNPRLLLRACVYAGLAVFGLISSAVWWNKLIWLIGMAFLCGTYRQARLHDGDFQRRMVWIFIPRPWRSWPLEKFVEIEIIYESPLSLAKFGFLALFDFILFLWLRFFDWLFPWFGGSYKLRLRPPKGPRVVVWQGNSEKNFEANLDLLQDATGLKSSRKQR